MSAGSCGFLVTSPYSLYIVFPGGIIASQQLNGHRNVCEPLSICVCINLRIHGKQANCLCIALHVIKNVTSSFTSVTLLKETGAHKGLPHIKQQTSFLGV
jgi:hypothetical protein